MTGPIGRDALLAAAFLVWSELEVATGTVYGSVVVNVLAGLVSTTALAWRRTAPVGVALLCAGGLVFKTAWGLRLDGLALLAAVLIATYSLGRHEPLRRAAPTAAVVLVLGWLSLFGLPPADQSIANYPFIALWVCAPAAAGAALRTQVERAAFQADRAARAELHRDEHARQAVADERLRIARELHDTVAHAVSVMVLHAGAVRTRLPGTLHSERTALGAVEETGRRAIIELRRLLRVLRTDGSHSTYADAGIDVAPQPTLAELHRLVEDTRQLGVDVDLDIDIDTAAGRPTLEPAVEVSVYRIVQEALTNVRKHAGAHRVVVRLNLDQDCLRVCVTDDGAGPAAPNGNGHGLAGIRERAEVYGGTVNTTSPPGGGFTLDVALPVTGP